MADNDTLKLIKKALKIFPKVVKEKERAAKEREKDIRRFAKLSKQLAKLQAAQNGQQDSIIVHEHERHVPISEKNPDGSTHVHQYLRKINRRQLTTDDIQGIVENYDLEGVTFPTKNKLEYLRADEFDRLIAIWMDFFNKLLAPDSPMDPDILKALIGSESSFDPEPKPNKIAFGLTQITKSTLKILQDPEGEAKEFIFKDIKPSDLKNPNVAIALAARWLHRKQKTAQAAIGQTPSTEQIILEYKGLLKSRSNWKKNALKKFNRDFELLKK